MAQGNYGTSNNPLEEIHSEQVVYDALTSDPSDREEGSEWFRADMDSGDKVGTMRIQNDDAGNDIDNWPAFPEADSVDGVVKMFPIQTENGEAFLPYVEEGGAFNQKRFQHDGTWYGAHNALSVIIDNIITIDDWADGNVTSSRDTLDETAFQPAGSEFVPQGQDGNVQRPSWSTVDGGATASNNELTFDSSDTAVEASSTDFDGLTWEIGWEFPQNESGLFTILIHLPDNPSWSSGNSAKTTDNNYAVQINGPGAGNNHRFTKHVNGTFTELISATWQPDTNEHVTKVTVDDSGNFELFLDGTSLGTVQDTSHSEGDKGNVGLSTGNDGTGPAVNWFLEWDSGSGN